MASTVDMRRPLTFSKSASAAPRSLTFPMVTLREFRNLKSVTPIRVNPPSVEASIGLNAL